MTRDSTNNGCSAHFPLLFELSDKESKQKHLFLQNPFRKLSEQENEKNIFFQKIKKAAQDISWAAFSHIYLKFKD
ncbi:hypothetical protein C6H88_03745 [Chlamydia muridarum str. Nigg]|uniref:Uncharacterized protein n=1 Tax=Chlamydia muridarum TaxID=83560 RepID=A0A069ZZD5_CHLMR|nr:hypothetical protein TAC_03820 [Chlamydia muridarum str. Nigg3 CMUT3-5]AHH24248.1 hypothetical protein Y015_03820 [Chlamydia muridarum str. Nigg CM972]AID38441.1 hypothetical protein BB17_03870 [Chlamydia muridarum str. Nigg 2 MCR]AIT91775.1 hypothetical protein NC81_03670 [Chlamydia muridarum]AVM88457.1 hypothetical protein C6H96_03745 [Chlamydia muridarum str. Nigg]